MLSRAMTSHTSATPLSEADETHYWLRLAKATHLLAAAQVDDLITEAAELVRILAAIVKKTQITAEPAS